MKKRFLLFFAIIFFFFFSGSATALFFSDTHHNNIWLDSHHPTHTWSFDLDDEMLNWGDINSGDVIDSVFLWFGTYDDRDGYESADILLNGFPAVANWEVDPGWWTLGNVSMTIYWTSFSIDPLEILAFPGLTCTGIIQKTHRRQPRRFPNQPPWYLWA
jgi:hypothetical protein